jgi:hypothetical protein
MTRKYQSDPDFLVGLGGGLAGNAEFGAGFVDGPLQSGLSTANTVFAGISGISPGGVPIDAGFSVSNSSDGTSVTFSGRGGIGTFVGAGVGQTRTATLVTPPLIKKEIE